MKIENYIDGKFQPAAQTFEKINPATGQKLAEVSRSSAKDVGKALESATRAFKTWSQTSIESRAKILETIARKIEDNFELLAKAESLDTGKPISLSRKMDITRAQQNFKFFAELGYQKFEEKFVQDENQSYTRREPVGVAALITPWNLPLYLLTWKLAPALLMGNTVVAKPSELTPTTAFLLCQWLEEAGVPPGVVNMIHGYGSEMGDFLTSHKLTKLISFTGGTATGSRIAAQAASTFKKVSLELGGKNPTVVFSDCDLDRAIKGVTRASFLNQGQICLCGSRLLVQRDLAPQFIEKMKAEIGSWKIGDPLNDSTQFGSLISKEHREKVQKYVKIAAENGGEVVFGGKIPALEKSLSEGAFFEPTIIINKNPECPSVKEEIFGPVVTVQTFSSEEQALQLANNTEYGLSASIWTKDLEKAQRLAHKIDAGTVWINSWLARDLRTPFGGFKNSGLGREGGQYSLNFFSEAKTVSRFTGGLS